MALSNSRHRSDVSGKRRAVRAGALALGATTIALVASGLAALMLPLVRFNLVEPRRAASTSASDTPNAAAIPATETPRPAKAPGSLRSASGRRRRWWFATTPRA